MRSHGRPIRPTGRQRRRRTPTRWRERRPRTSRSGRGRWLAAVYDVRTGQTWRLGEGRAQPAASVVKLDVLEALLAQRRSGLSAANRSLAQLMIEDSDNDAATSLWYAAGGAAGLQAYKGRQA